jgi:hypothetical protein
MALAPVGQCFQPILSGQSDERLEGCRLSDAPRLKGHVVRYTENLPIIVHLANVSANSSPNSPNREAPIWTSNSKTC